MTFLRVLTKAVIQLSAAVSFSLALSPAYAAWYDSSSLWQKSEISVCWADAMPKDLCEDLQTEQILSSSQSVPTSRILRSQIQNLVGSEYEKSRTGIHFIGWASCEISPDADVKIVIIRNASKTSISAIGNCSDLQGGRIAGQPFVTVAIGSKQAVDKDMQNSILHEFGHLAGLLHEDDASIQADKNTDFKNIGGRDPFSIMSYKFDDLSLRSKAFLRSLPKEYQHGDANVAILRTDVYNQAYLDLRVGLSTHDVRALHSLYFDK